MLQRMAEAEQEQEERSLCPLAKDGCPGSRHEHQEIYLEPAPADGFERLFRRKKSAEKVRPNVAGQ